MIQKSNKLLNYLSGFKKVIIFSPHLDDAILSTGSLMHYLSNNRVEVSVYTFFTKPSKIRSTLVGKLLRQSGFTNSYDYFKARRKEDRSVLKKFGHIKVSHLGLIDAAWREISKKALYPSSTIGVPNKRDLKTQKAIIKKMESLAILTNQTMIFAPIGRGKHIDHIFVRDGAVKVYKKIIFYSDFPYSQQYPEDKNFIKTHQLTSVIWKKDNYEQKKTAILDYKTQQNSLFAGKSFRLPFEKYFIGITA